MDNKWLTKDTRPFLDCTPLLKTLFASFYFSVVKLPVQASNIHIPVARSKTQANSFAGNPLWPFSGDLLLIHQHQLTCHFPSESYCWGPCWLPIQPPDSLYHFISHSPLYHFPHITQEKLMSGKSLFTKVHCKKLLLLQCLRWMLLS